MASTDASIEGGSSRLAAGSGALGDARCGRREGRSHGPRRALDLVMLGQVDAFSTDASSTDASSTDTRVGASAAATSSTRAIVRARGPGEAAERGRRSGGVDHVDVVDAFCTDTLFPLTLAASRVDDEDILRGFG